MEQTFSDNLLMERGHPHGNFILAVIAGLAAAFFAAIIGMTIGLATGWQVGVLALPMAIMVGGAIGASGRGAHFIYGVLGIIFTGLGCLAGQMAVAIISATNSSLDLYGALTHVHIDALIVAIISQTSTMMAVIYAISAFVAFKLSIRK